MRNIFTAILITMTILHATAQPVSTKIRHTVVFTLKHEKGSAGEQAFFKALDQLTTIPGVVNFNYTAEISKKNIYDYILAMEFSDQGSYDRYNQHPDHVLFVQEIWLKEVQDFLEIDYFIE
jgi:hypothetical protein